MNKPLAALNLGDAVVWAGTCAVMSILPCLLAINGFLTLNTFSSWLFLAALIAAVPFLGIALLARIQAPQTIFPKRRVVGGLLSWAPHMGLAATACLLFTLAPLVPSSAQLLEAGPDLQDSGNGEYSYFHVIPDSEWAIEALPPDRLPGFLVRSYPETYPEPSSPIATDPVPSDTLPRPPVKDHPKSCDQFENRFVSLLRRARTICGEHYSLVQIRIYGSKVHCTALAPLTDFNFCSCFEEITEGRREIFALSQCGPREAYRDRTTLHVEKNESAGHGGDNLEREVSSPPPKNPFGE